MDKDIAEITSSRLTEPHPTAILSRKLETGRNKRRLHTQVSGPKSV